MTNEETLEVKERILNNMGLTLHIAKKYMPNCIMNHRLDFEDVVSIGMIGLIKAARTFNKEKNPTFSTYAGRCIDNEIRIHLRSANKQSNELYLSDTLNVAHNRDNDGDTITLEETIPTDDDDLAKFISDSENAEIAQSLLSHLTERERILVEMRYGFPPYDSPMLQREISEMTGLSQSYISRLDGGIIAKLRKIYNDIV